MEVLARAREFSRLKRTLTWLRKPHLLLVDEVGHENLTPRMKDRLKLGVVDLARG